LKRYILPILIFAFACNVFAQVADPGTMPRWDRFKAYIQNGSMTFTYKTLTSPTIASATVSGTFTGNLAVSGKWTIANNYPWVTSSKITADSIVVPYLSGVSNAMEVKAKLTIPANYPLVSSSGITADSVSVTGGNMTVIDIDSVATAGSVNRWLKITVSKAGATGKPVSYYVPADTATVL
jgi:hypothetical protein